MVVERTWPLSPPRSPPFPSPGWKWARPAWSCPLTQVFCIPWPGHHGKGEARMHSTQSWSHHSYNLPVPSGETPAICPVHLSKLAFPPWKVCLPLQPYGVPGTCHVPFARVPSCMAASSACPKLREARKPSLSALTWFPGHSSRAPVLTSTMAYCPSGPLPPRVSLPSFPEDRDPVGLSLWPWCQAQEKLTPHCAVNE